MRSLPSQGGGLPGSSTLASPAAIVLLVLLLGATVYLWRQRYMRRKTAYVLLTILAIALIVVGFFTYKSLG
jgi:peptidoglycan/LPS O-acetylase OafA/YrhL